jgi:hypothetical protein
MVVLDLVLVEAKSERMAGSATEYVFNLFQDTDQASCQRSPKGVRIG